MTYQVQVPAQVEGALDRLRGIDPAGAELVVGMIAALAADPRPTGVHMLSEAAGLHRIHRARIEPGTGRCLEYRVMYQIEDRRLVVIVITAGALPRASRRR
jgi:mRNA-degrading endonuclease RelE of RelBE toxin-antitoxin system